MNAPNTLRELLPAGVQGTELIHESAHLHVTGAAVYTDDIPEQRGTLYAALVKSPVAHGELMGEGIDLTRRVRHAHQRQQLDRREPGV